MFKHLFFAAFLTLFMAPNSHAILFSSGGTVEFDQHSNDEAFPPLIITAESDDEITVENGLTILVENGSELILDRNISNLSYSGNAASKIDDTVDPVFSNDGYRVHFTVKEDFVDGDTVEISNIYPRTFEKEQGARVLGLDHTGDGVRDISNVFTYRVNTTIQTDFILPYPAYDLEAAYNAAEGEVNVSWSMSPDKDVWRVFLDRTITRDGVTTNKEAVAFDDVLSSYKDTDVQEGDEITYTVRNSDGRNIGESASVTIEVSANPVEGEEETPQEEPEVETSLTVEEQELTDRFDFRTIRYRIKCLPSGIAVSENDSECLWSKIQLQYAQEILDRNDYNISLSERELFVIGTRLRFAKERRERSCIEADTPAAYCSALTKDISRAEYFLDQ